MSRLRPRSLSGRITLLLLVTSLLLLGGGSLVMDHQVDHELEHRFRQGLLAQAQSLIVSLQTDSSQPQAPSTGKWPTGLPGSDKFSYSVHCGGREWLHSSTPLPSHPPGWPADATTTPRLGETIQSSRRHVGWVMLAFDLSPDTGPAPRALAPAASSMRACRLLLMQDRSRLDEVMRNIDWILALGPALSLLIAFLAVPPIVRGGMRPLDALGERMGDIGPNEPGRRLATSGMRELDPLIARFNEVLARMDEGLARERQFAGGLAHETRTRLAELRTLCEVESRYPSGRALPDLLGELGTIGAELEAIVNALLLLTRLQSRLEPPQLSAVELPPLVEHLLQRHAAGARQRGIDLNLLVSAPVAWQSDPALLEVILGNLLGNACSYAPDGDTIDVRIDDDGIAIENTAPELEPGDLPHFGQRFWRKQPPHSGHAGLGLALASAAAQALQLQLDYTLHQGRLQARLHQSAPR